MALADLERCGLDCASVRVPEFGLLALDAEGCVEGLGVVISIIDEVDVGLGEMAVDEEEFGIGLWFGIGEVWGDLGCHPAAAQPSLLTKAAQRINSVRLRRKKPKHFVPVAKSQ